MDENAATEFPASSTEEELGDVDAAPDDPEVEGHSMAISANFAIDIGGVATPPVPGVVESDGGPTPVSGTSTDSRPQVR